MMHQPCDVEDVLVYYASMDVGPGHDAITYVETDSPLNENLEICVQDILYSKLQAVYLMQWIVAVALRNDPNLAAEIEVAALREAGYSFH